MTAFLFPQAKAVLIHIPKTAGTSIRNGFFKGEYEGPVQGDLPEEWQGYFKFAFVRNPFDRLISAWKMFTSGMDNTEWKYPEDGDRELTLKQFLKIAMDESIPVYVKNRPTFELKLRHHAIPQTHPFYCLDEADFVGRYESLAEDFQKICDKLQLEGELPHWNKTDRGSYRQYFDDETKAMAFDFYKEDVEKLEYEF